MYVVQSSRKLCSVDEFSAFQCYTTITGKTRATIFPRFSPSHEFFINNQATYLRRLKYPNAPSHLYIKSQKYKIKSSACFSSWKKPHLARSLRQSRDKISTNIPHRSTSKFDIPNFRNFSNFLYELDHKNQPNLLTFSRTSKITFFERYSIYFINAHLRINLRNRIRNPVTKTSNNITIHNLLNIEETLIQYTKKKKYWFRKK